VLKEKTVYCISLILMALNCSITHFFILYAGNQEQNKKLISYNTKH